MAVVDVFDASVAREERLGLEGVANAKAILAVGLVVVVIIALRQVDLARVGAAVGGRNRCAIQVLTITQRWAQDRHYAVT